MIFHPIGEKNWLCSSFSGKCTCKKMTFIPQCSWHEPRLTRVFLEKAAKYRRKRHFYLGRASLTRVKLMSRTFRGVNVPFLKYT